MAPSLASALTAQAPSFSAPYIESATLRHPLVVRRLRERGVASELLDGETEDTFRERLETALMSLFRDERDNTVFQALYEVSRGALLQWLVSLGAARRSVTDFDALIQDTFVNIYRYAGGFRDDHVRSFRVWSRTIAGNVARRSRMRSRAVTLESFPDRPIEVADAHAGPVATLELGEERRSIAAAWMIVLAQYVQAYRELAPRDRLALELIEVQGLSYADASARMRVGLSNMKMILFRARHRIRAAIGSTLRAREEKVRRLAS
jgi:RNA polymerase sigma factor (sigma-70 family)